MKKLFSVIPLVFLCCSIIGCQQGERALVEPKVDVTADIQAIKDVVTEIEAVTNSADVDKGMSLYADEAISIRPNEPAAIGKEAIQKNAQQMFDEISTQEKDIVEDVEVGGDLAVAHVTWSALVTPRAGGEPFNANGNWILVFKRESVETWKIIYSIWSDESLIYPTQAE